MNDAGSQKGPRLVDANFARFIESVSDYAIFSLDPEGNVASWNRGAERLKGYTADEIIGRHFSTFYDDEDKAAGLPQALLREAIEKGHSEHTGWSYRKDGGRLWCNVVVTSVYDTDGTLLGFTKITRDLTERKEAQEREHELTVGLERANRMKSQFLANMSHEIRTPLNGVIGMLSLLLDTDLSDRQREFAEMAASSSEGLLRIVNDILDFSKVEAGKIELEMRQFDLRTFLREICDLFRPQALSKNLDLSLVVDDGTPQRVVGDAGRLRQVFVNLIGNACKFTHHGGITVLAGVEERSDSHAIMRFEVTDTGIGLAESDKARLFTAFSQADVSTTRIFGGSGLGLAISRQLVELMDGEMDVSSELGVGSTFWFTTPFRLAPDILPIADNHISDNGMQHVHVSPRGRVLIVEDNLVNQRVTALLVEKLGYVADVVDNGEGALQAVQKNSYDAVLMDCQMPVMDGYEATRRIRASGERYEEIPIIALTAAALPEERESCLKAGMDDYLSKPVMQPDLAEVLERYVPEHGWALTLEGDETANSLERLYALKETLGDQFDTVLEAFITTSAERLQALRQAVIRSDRPEAQNLSHALRTTSFTLGAEDLGLVAARMEERALSGDLAGAGALMKELFEAFEATRATFHERFAFSE